jgi:predicted dehydrogenase
LRAKARADEFGVPRSYAQLEDALADGEIDAVDVATPRATHVALIEMAAQYGADVLCQKPLAPTLAEGLDLARRIAGRARVMVHENWRFRPWYRRARQWIDLGLLGESLQVDMAMQSSGLLADENGSRPIIVRQPFMADEPRLMIGEVLIHHLDVLRWLFGPLRVVAASSLRTLPEAIAGETLSTISLKTANGAPVTLRGSMVSHGAPARTMDSLEAVGGIGTLRLAGLTLSLAGAKPMRERFSFARSYQRSFDDVIHHFVERLADGRPFETELADNLETLRLVEDAYAMSDAAGKGRK